MKKDEYYVLEHVDTDRRPEYVVGLAVYADLESGNFTGSIGIQIGPLASLGEGPRAKNINPTDVELWVALYYAQERLLSNPEVKEFADKLATLFREKRINQQTEAMLVDPAVERVIANSRTAQSMESREAARRARKLRGL